MMSIQENSCYRCGSVSLPNIRNYTTEPEHDSGQLIELFKKMKLELGGLKEELNQRIETEKLEILQAIETVCQAGELCKSGKQEFSIVERLGSFLIEGFDENMMQEFNRIFISTLVKLVDSNDLDTIKKILPLTKLKKIDINAPDDEGRRVLFAAAKVGNKEIFEFLLKQKNMNVNAYDESSLNTPFIVLMNHNHLGLAKELVARKLVDLEFPDIGGNLAIHVAACCDDPQVLREILQNKNANINAKNNEGETPLIIASMMRLTENVRLLIQQKDIDLDAKNSRYVTAFKIAYILEETAILDLLTKAKEDKEWSKKVLSAIHFFQKISGVGGLQEERWYKKDLQTGLYTIEYLTKVCKEKLNEGFITYVNDRIIDQDLSSLKKILPLAGVKGFDLNSAGIKQSKVLLLAASRGYKEIFNLLLEQPSIDVNVHSEPLQTTALMALIDNGYLEMAKQFMQREDLKLDCSDIEKQSIIHFSIHTNNAEFLTSILIDKRIDINARDKDQETALIQASAHGYLESLKVLVQQDDIDLNACDVDGCNALHAAVSFENVECVKILLKQKEKGFDLFKLNKASHNAFDIAKLSNNTGIINILRPYFLPGHKTNNKRRGSASFRTRQFSGSQKSKFSKI